MGRVKSTPKNLELSSEVIPISARGFRNDGRFQVAVEYDAGVFVFTARTESLQEATEAFFVQAPGRDKGAIVLFDRAEQRVLASVTWKMDTTENGLCVPHRQNVFHDWHLALIAVDEQKRRSGQADLE